MARIVARTSTSTTFVALTSAAILLTGFGIAPASAQPIRDVASADGTAQPAPTVGHHDTDLSSSRRGPLERLDDGQATVFVRLAGDGAAAVSRRVIRAVPGSPAAKRSAARTAALERRSEIRSTADSVVRAAKARDARASGLFRSTNSIPGVAMTASAAALRALAARDDVVEISAIVPKRPDNSGAAQLTTVLDSWQNLGVTGEGITVGIIDTGLDFTHADFGGTGTAGAYASAHATPADPGWYAALPALAQAKIAGGYDFAGDAYTGYNTPAPDTDPLDCHGHGTHVSGTVAGYGVTSSGETYAGDYTTLTGAALDEMTVSPGMAPKASLYPLKVFGCSGSTNLVIPALDASLDPNGDGDFSDHLDLINVSLGASFAAADDPEDDVVNAIAAGGVLPVMSAGNSGDLTDAGGSPGNAVRSLAVASSVDALQLRDGLQVNAPSSSVAAGQNSHAYPWVSKPPVTGDVVAIPGANADGCTTFTAEEAAAVTGKVAWLEWDDNDATRRCSSATRGAKARAAGAIGVILTSSLNVFASGITGDSLIPMFQLPLAGTDELRPYLDAHTLNVTFDASLAATIHDTTDAIVDTLSSFSSRGVHGSVGVVKPDVSAPGDTIGSADIGSGTGGTVMSGTSMASPHTAGVAALVFAQHPTWTAEQVKAAIMNTARHDLYDAEGQTGNVYGPNRVGAGRVDAQAAVNTDVLAYDTDTPGAVSASFGVVEAPAGQPVVIRTRTLQVQNTGSLPVALTLSYDAVVSQPGVAYTVLPSLLVLAGGQSATVTVTMTITTLLLRHTIDPTMGVTQSSVWDGYLAGPAARQYVADASGRVLIAEVGHPTLRVPVYGAAKPASELTARVTPLSGSPAVTMSGLGLDQGSGSTAYRSLVSVMQFGAQSAQLPACAPGEPVDNCTLNQTATGGDIQYVGAGTAPYDGSLQNGWLWFGIATYGNSATIGNSVIPYVDIDVTGDGDWDYEIWAENDDNTDVLTAWTYERSSGYIVDFEPVNFNFGDVDTNVYDSNVVLLPVWPAAIGLRDTDTTFPITYTAGTYSYYGSPSLGWDIDRVGPVAYNPAHPAVGVSSPLWIGAPAATIPTDTPGAGTALVVHLHNATGARAQKLTLRVPTALSISASSTIAYGAATTISTRLTHSADGTGIAGAVVSLYSRTSPTGSWLKVRDKVTLADGRAATSVTPKRLTYYQWRFAGDALHVTSTSATRTIAVKRVASAYATPTRVGHGRQFQVWGKLTPTQTGLAVHLQRYLNGRWSTVASTRIATRRLPNGQYTSGYLFPTRTNLHGTAKYRVVVTPYGGLTSGMSRTVAVLIL